MAVCLCTEPLLPEPSGIPARHRLAFRRWSESLDAARARRLLDAAKALWSRLESLHARVDRLQRPMAHFAKRLDPDHPLPRPRPASRREAATHGCDSLVADLHRHAGVRFRQARCAVNAVVAAWTAALARHQAVKTPAGTLRVTPKGHFRLKPSPAVAALFRIQPMPTNTAAKIVSCPQCGSPYFAETHFRRYDTRFYGTGDGMVSISAPQRLYLCLCGTPFLPKLTQRGRLRSADEESFLDSNRLASKYLKRLHARITALTSSLPSKEELGLLERRIAGLEHHLAALAAQLKGPHLRSNTKP